MSKGLAIGLAWPETFCKQPSSWYDLPLSILGINKKGYYRVGHAAIVLVNIETPECLYFDFGRYHAPYGYGRVRDVETDHDLLIKSYPVISEENKLGNAEEILSELSRNDSCHGTGRLYGAIAQINFEKAYVYAKQLQEKEFIHYGPFVKGGTNCSRFVCDVLKEGVESNLVSHRLRLPLSFTPTPLSNLRALGSIIYPK